MTESFSHVRNCHVWKLTTGVFCNRTAKHQKEWASRMIASTETVQAYVDWFNDYILQLSRRKYGGFSALCRIMPNALPITTAFTSLTLNDCIVTGVLQRPCFDVMSGKHGETSSFIHHAEMRCCQSIWTIVHTANLLSCAVTCFREHNTEEMLAQSVASFKVSEEYNRTVDYLYYTLVDVCKIFSEDNVLQTNSDE